MDTETIRVLIVDDHPVVREGLRAVIETEPGMQVVGEAVDGVQAVQRVLQYRPDVVLLDLLMPRKDGAQAILEIKREFQEARILVLTSFAEDERIFQAVKAGALGYLLKDSSPRELLEAIRNVFHGESSLHPAIARKLIDEFSRPRQPLFEAEQLTPRETEILRYVARGFSNQQIADQLVLSERTVRSHVSSLLTKLHLASRTQAALYAIRAGIELVESA